MFARYLNPMAGYVSQLERGANRPTGPSLVLLNVIRRKGIEGDLEETHVAHDNALVSRHSFTFSKDKAC